MKVINMISGPRNLSTAIMYSFGNRSDCEVVDEPFYAHYLNTTNVDHPGREEILQSQPINPDQVITNLLHHGYHDFRFIKNMAHHLEKVDLSFLEKLDNIFLIRDVKQLIASFSQVIEHPQMRDIGIKHEYELFRFLQSKKVKPIVLDSGELLKSPENVLKKLCQELEIPFLSSMLHWPKGKKKEDGIWAKFWYKNVHQSTGFQKQKTSSRPLREDLVPLYQEAKVYYDQLFLNAIKA